MILRPRGGVVPDVRRMAVLRANGLGDFVFSLPALTALRAAYPAAEIVYLGARWHPSLLDGRRGLVDRVVVVPPAHGVTEPGSYQDDPAVLEPFFARMVAEEFDLALQMHGGGQNSNPFLLRLGARVTAGLKSSSAPPLDRWVPYNYFQHEVLRYLEVVSLVGATEAGLEPRIAVTADDLAAAEQFCPQTARPLAVLHPGAGDSGRRWPPTKFAEVGDALAAAGARVAIIGTAPEGELADGVCATMRAEALNLCGRLTMSALVGVLARAAVVVSNDSGPLHLAGACGAATVGIYWAYNLVTAGPLTTAHHRSVTSWQLTCPICGADRATGRCPHQPSFVANVPVEDVTAAALDLLAMGR